MGYYIAYDLVIRGDDEIKIKKAEQDLLQISNNDIEVKELIETGSAYAKLYDIDKWILKAAMQNPDVLFILQGDGEGSADLWEQRFRGDISELHKCIIPPFTNPVLMTESEKMTEIFKNSDK